MFVGTALFVHGTVGICTEMVARGAGRQMHGNNQHLHGDSWHLCRDNSFLHGDSLCLHGTARFHTGTTCVCTGTPGACMGQPRRAQRWPLPAWDSWCVPGDSCRGHGDSQYVHGDSLGHRWCGHSGNAGGGCCKSGAGLLGSVAAPPGQCQVTFVALGQGLGGSCLLRDLANALRNDGWDGAGPTQVRVSPWSLFTSGLGFHSLPCSPSSSSPFPAAPTADPSSEVPCSSPRTCQDASQLLLG